MSQNIPAPLAPLYALIGPDLEQVNRLVLEHLDSQVALIPTLGTHLISGGGKRLRPILTLVSARMFGYGGQDHALMAATIEYIHTATLLHDDVVDKSSTRRGRLTANSVWGNKAPVLVGDFLFSRVFQLLVRHGDLRVLEIIANACAVLSEGEVMQLVVSNDLRNGEKEYLEVVTRKTATLFEAAAQLGAVVSDRPVADQERLARYGRLLGTAYQVVDDALDYSAKQETLGKSIGDDYRDGKITLPVIHAFSHGTDEERTFWRAALERKEQPEGSLERAITLIRERGSLHYAMEKAHGFIAGAKEALSALPDGPEKEALLALADFSVDRSY
jgi:octaprenyl-diphosphate synthase